MKAVNIKSCITILVCILSISACNEQKTNDSFVPTEVITFSNLKKSKFSDFMNDSSMTYILLKGLKNNEIFGRIDKIMIVGNKIYIADTRMRFLLVYDNTGNYITKIGKQGQGPGEYVNLSDFDVDNRGYVYILDGNLNKLFLYNSNYEWVKDYKLSFEADVFSILNNNSLIFGLSSWNKGDGSGNKIGLSNKEGKLEEAFMPYDDFVDPAYWISGYQFADTDEGLAYNQTIDNNIYILSSNGILKKIINIDFENENVPKEDKKEVEMKLNKFKHYSLIRKILSVTDKYIVGFIWEHCQTKLFTIDRSTKTCFISDTISDVDRRIGCGFSNNKIISYIDTENPELPDSVNQFVKNDGIALKIQRIE